MPWIKGRYYMNPAYGRALERARLAEEGRVWSEWIPEPEVLPVRDEDFWNDEPADGTQQQQEDGHWVTIDHRHVLIDQARAGRTRSGQASRLSARDQAYLDKYYDAVAVLAKRYNVDPALVLGVGIESSFASHRELISGRPTRLE